MASRPGSGRTYGAWLVVAALLGAGVAAFLQTTDAFGYLRVAVLLGTGGFLVVALFAANPGDLGVHRNTMTAGVWASGFLLAFDLFGAMGAVLNPGRPFDPNVPVMAVNALPLAAYVAYRLGRWAGLEPVSAT